MDLADYERRKFELAELLRSAAVLRRKREDGRDEEVQDLLARLAEDRFNLVVVGRFSRGKSTLMNAILGMDRLPTGIAPLTSVVTAVCYGSEEHVSLSFQDRSLRQDVPLDQLADYVTQQGNPGNVRRVEIAEIRLPAEILRRGFYFIDTPGLGSAVRENTRTTQAFLPAADAFLLVTGYESPLSEEEIEALRTAAAAAKPAFVVLNKQDIIPDPAQRAQALDFVRGQLRELFGGQAPKIYSTSALQALRAKAAGDAAGLAATGVAELEQDLIGFMAREKSEAFLLQTCFRIGALLRSLPETADAEALRARLAAVRRAVAADCGTPRARIGGLEPVHPEAADACQFCRAVEKASFDFLSQFQYAVSINPSARDDLAHAGGLCPLHTWSYNSLASPRGICLAYPDLLEHWAAALAKMADEGTPPNLAAELIAAQRPDREACRACQACAEAERKALAAAAQALNVEGAADEMSAVCLDHLAALLPMIEDAAAASRLLHRSAGLFEQMAEDMRRYAIKFDGLRRALASRAEENAAARALRMMAGLPNMTYIRRSDRLPW